MSHVMVYPIVGILLWERNTVNQNLRNFVRFLNHDNLRSITSPQGNNNWIHKFLLSLY